MAASDFRSRNNRSRRTTTQTHTERRMVPTWTKTGVKQTPDEYHVKNHMTKLDSPVEAGGRTYTHRVNGGIYTRSGSREPALFSIEGKKGDEYSGYYGTQSSKQQTRHYTSQSTSYNPDDDRGDDDDTSKSEKARLKKKGRSGLRIQLQADPSAGRLKGQDARVKKKSGAQGGGPTGLNIPR